MGFCNEVRTHRYRAWKAICTNLLFTALGLHSGSFGPALIDLMVQVGTTINRITYILPTRAFGNMIGSIACGFILSYFDHQIVLMFSILAMSLSIISVPLCFQLWQLNVCMIINGIGSGFLVNAGNCFVIHKWGKENSPFMQAAHFSFGIGAFFSPFIIEPFLSNLSDIDEISKSNVKSSLETNSTDTDVQKIPLFDPTDLQLKYAYYAIGVLSLFTWALFLVTYLKKPDNKPHPTRAIGLKKEKKENSVKLEVVRSDEKLPKNVIKSDDKIFEDIVLEEQTSDTHQSVFNAEKNIKPYHKWVLILLASLFIHLAYGLELSFGVMLASFARLSGLQMSKTAASYITSLYWGCFTFFRLCTLILINFVSARSMLIIDMSLIMLSNIVLLPFLFVPGYNECALWIGSALMGIGVSSIYPTLWSFLEGILPVTSKMASIINSCVCVGEFIVPVIIGAYIETWPNIYIVIVFIYSFLAFLMLILKISWEKVINKYKRS